MSTSQFDYKPKEKDDSEVITLINSCIENTRYGCPMIVKKIRNKGHKINHKRIERVYKQLELTLPKKRKKKLPVREKQAILQPIHKNVCWSMDFMSDNLIDGRKIRTLNIIDDYNRECLCVEIATSLPTKRVIRALEHIGQYREYPMEIRVDNGPEYISNKLREWAKSKKINLAYIEPGKPTQNGLIERFNGTCRREFLDANLFYSIDHARELASEWMHEYNFERPHSALANRSPIEFKIWRESLLVDANKQQKYTTNQPPAVGVDISLQG